MIFNEVSSIFQQIYIPIDRFRKNIFFSKTVGLQLVKYMIIIIGATYIGYWSPEIKNTRL